MESLIHLGLFAAKIILVAVGVIVAVGGVVAVISLIQQRFRMKPALQVDAIHEEWNELKDQMETLGLEKKELKSFLKSKEKAQKAKEKAKLKGKEQEKENETQTSEGSLAETQQKSAKLFVLRFNGDKEASQVDSLRMEVSSILSTATPSDEVLIEIESPGGTVHGYGFAASQLERLKQAKIPLTVAVNRVAASGGYLMSCVADRIIASPFSIIGSVGVVAALPNIHRLLKKNDIDMKEYTAGEFKRTVGIFTEITPKAEEKFLQQLTEVHTQFRDFVLKYRPQLKDFEFATGEYWLAARAKELGLVDSLSTSDDYILSKLQQGWKVFEIKYQRKKSFLEKLTQGAEQAAAQAAQKFFEKLENHWYP